MTLARCWLENRALQMGYLLVPATQREDWRRSWEAELWYERRRGRNELALGLIRDALWLRVDCWQQKLAGTALLCLLVLLALLGSALLPLSMAADRGSLPKGMLLELLPRFAVAACLTQFVSYATSFVTIAASRPSQDQRRYRGPAFHAAKVVLLLLSAALISTDVCLPLELCKSFVALPLELLCFVLLTLFALRWNFNDGQARCKHCLRALAPPHRVGRPSWNFLDYNGTEFACRDGHGLLTVPELETSWCRSSSWVPQQF